MKWNEVAKIVENDFDTQVDWAEKFFVCPDCGDVVYECDFNTYSVLALGYCPICGTALTEKCEYENFYEHEEEEYARYEEYDDEDEMMYARYDGEDEYEYED